MEAIQITREQFVNYVINNCTSKGRLVSVTLNTEPKMNKGRGANLNPYYGRVNKVSTASYRFNSDYEQTINNRLKKEGKEANFVAEPMSGRVWLDINKLECHENGTIYLRLYQNKNACRKSIYYIDGREATPNEIAEIKKWLTKQTHPQKQIRHGLTNLYEVRSPKIDNIVSITMNKTKFVLTD